MHHDKVSSITFFHADKDSFNFNTTLSRADLEVQLMQQNHCDGVLSNDWNTY